MYRYSISIGRLEYLTEGWVMHELEYKPIEFISMCERVKEEIGEYSGEKNVYFYALYLRDVRDKLIEYYNFSLHPDIVTNYWVGE